MSRLVLGWADLLDVAVVAVFAFVALRLLRRTRARPALAGLAVLGGVYVLARQIGLTLTAGLLQGFFAVFVVVLVVVFQDDLRRFFEQLGSWRPGWRRGGRQAVPDPDGADLLARAAARLAQMRVGALLVLPGREPLERHLEGGIVLGGRLSEPLLLSLFDSSSPGHDGAILVRGDRVERFAVHLPLSSNRAALGAGGTRHAAALGLSERCDALCLVVSEERGTVSVAEGGQLRRLAGSGELAAAIRDHGGGGAGDAPTPRTWPWPEALGALALALVLWLVFVPGSVVTEVTLEAPVVVEKLPDGWRLDAVEPAEVAVTLSGRRRDVLLASEEEIVVRLDALLVKLGRRTFEVDPDAVRAPPGLTPLRVDPARVRLSLSRLDGEEG